LATQDDIARLLDELVRLHVYALRRDSKQVDAIRELTSAGLGPSRIAELLGTTANTVNVALAREKKRKVTTRAKGTEK
jgi:hypothetical protein